MLHNHLRRALTNDDTTRIACIGEVDSVCGNMIIACNESASSEVTVELILCLELRLHIKESVDHSFSYALVIRLYAKLVFDEPRRDMPRSRMTHLIFRGTCSTHVIGDQLFCFGLPVKSALFLLVLFGHVHRDILRNEMSIGSMAVSDSAEPITLQNAVFHLLSNQCLAFSIDLRDKDRVLVDFRRASASHVAGH